MAVMDFREGGYIFSRHKTRREFSYDQAGDADESLFAADIEGREGLIGRVARLTHYLGALASVGLIVGLIVWGVQLVSRDVSGVPVIKAIAGDARTTPDDPGGQLAARTGLAVSDVAAGAQPAPTQQVAIAPNATELSSDDLAMGQFGATAHEPQNPSDTPLDFASEQVVPLSDAEVRARIQADLALQEAAIVDAPALEGPVTAAVTDENGQPTRDAAITAALTEAHAAPPTGLTRSARPAPRPRNARVAAPVAAPAPAAAAAPTVQVASGTPLVQIGAFDSNAIAQSEWSRLSGKFASLFNGKNPVIQQHQANGRSFWRLRVAGFGNRSDAQSFCSAMKARGTDCMAITAR